MNLPEGLSQYLNKCGWGSVVAIESIGGGYINAVCLLQTERGPPSLLKTNSKSPKDMFMREHEGLCALSVTRGLRIPAVYECGDNWLLMEYIPNANPASNYWSVLGEGLAQIHLTMGESFGFSEDNFIGSTVQINSWTDDGHEFFAEHRLRFQGRLAFDKGLLGKEDYRLLNWIACGLNDLIPSQPPSLIHGDLWIGNLISGPGGIPVIIDPAVHFGWAEAELAMTNLFGQFDAEAYVAYEGVRPLEPGYRDRIDIYNLYHLLNHLNIFGKVYLPQVQSILRRYI